MLVSVILLPDLVQKLYQMEIKNTMIHSPVGLSFLKFLTFFLLLVIPFLALLVSPEKLPFFGKDHLSLSQMTSLRTAVDLLSVSAPAVHSNSSHASLTQTQDAKLSLFMGERNDVSDWVEAIALIYNKIPASFGVQFCWIDCLCHCFYPQLQLAGFLCHRIYLHTSFINQ